MSEKSLIQMLSALKRVPMHMPGHKRDLAEFPWLSVPCGAWDVTEIAGFDDLYAPNGVLGDLLGRVAALWGSRRAFLSVNGSTGALFAALSLFKDRGVLAARNCHRSVFAAAQQLGIRTEYLMPDVAEGQGIFGSVSAAETAKRLDETGCGAVVITSPTYEGVLSDIASVAREAHARGAVLIVDCAHGAHLGLSDAFPDGGVREGADIVVSSLHKTLPALTQTAVLHVCSERVSADDAAAAIAAFCTSSPSYVLMASVEGAVGYLEKKAAEKERELVGMLSSFRAKTASLKHLKVFDGERDKCTSIFKTDVSKIYIDCKNCDLSGYELKRRLLDEAGIELESASLRGAIAYATVADKAEDLDLLARALERIDLECGEGEKSEMSLPVPGEKTMEMSAAAGMPWRKVSFADAVGCVAAEGVWVYPPGVPVLLPGERVTAEAAEFLAAAEREGAEVSSGRGAARGSVRVIA